MIKLKKLVKMLAVAGAVILVFTISACNNKKVVISDEPYFEGDTIEMIVESGVTYKEEPEEQVIDELENNILDENPTVEYAENGEERFNFLCDIEKKNIVEKDDKNEYIKIDYELIHLKDEYFLEDNNLRDEIKKVNDNEEAAVKEFDALLPEVKESFAGGEGYPATYEYFSKINVERMDQQIFSFTKETYEFLGGAHGTTILDHFNYSIAKKKLLNLSDVILDMPLMKEILIKRLDNMKEDLFPEYIDFINEKDNFDFLINDNGVDIIFQQYDIAPYATGIITIQLSKDNDDEKEVLHLEYFD